MTSANIVILGGGPCGLMAAWTFARAGVPVTVIEKEAHVGGLCSTTRRDGYQFDMGGHRFISRDSRLVESIKSLLGDRLLVRERKSAILLDGRRYEYPVNLHNVLTQSPLGLGARFGVGYIAAKIGVSQPRGPEGSFTSWADSRFGRPLNDAFFRPYTEKLWGISTDSLSSDWAGERIPAVSAWDAMKKILIRGDGSSYSYASKYLYPRGGIGEIFDTMADDIRNHGGRIITGAAPERLIIRNGVACGVTIRTDGGTVDVGAVSVLSTIPLDDLARIAEVDGATRLSYRSLRFMNITLSGVEDISTNTWMYTPDSLAIMTRIQEPKRRSPDSSPAGATSVMLEIPCEYGDETWRSSDDEIMDKCLASLDRLGFPLRRSVTGRFSTFARHAYPRYETGYKSKVESLIRSINRIRNLVTLGRQGLFRYSFMDQTMIMGRDWAERVLNGDAGTMRQDSSATSAPVIEAGSVAF